MATFRFQIYEKKIIIFDNNGIQNKINNNCYLNWDRLIDFLSIENSTNIPWGFLLNVINNVTSNSLTLARYNAIKVKRLKVQEKKDWKITWAILKYFRNWSYIW